MYTKKIAENLQKKINGYTGIKNIGYSDKYIFVYLNDYRAKHVVQKKYIMPEHVDIVKFKVIGIDAL